MDAETGLVIGFIGLLIFIFFMILGLLIHAGIFTPIDIRTGKPSIGDLTIAYKFACGPYKESGSLFTQCHTLLPKYKTVGVYYDDPRKREAHKLRYIVGLIVSEKKDKIVNPEDRKILEENGFKFASFPAIDYAVETSFPFNSTISIIVAVMRVYPALTQYIEKRSLCAHPFLEMYDNDKKELVFMGPLVRQHDFYVPEVLEDDEENRPDDDDDTVTERSWDESASIIHGDDLDKVDSLADDNSVCSSVAQNITSDEDGFKVPPVPIHNATPTPSTGSTQTVQSTETKKGEDSDANTASSFEEIDEKEAAALPLDPPVDNKEKSLDSSKEELVLQQGAEVTVKTAESQEEEEKTTDKQEEAER